jgi:hypothetical protein
MKKSYLFLLLFLASSLLFAQEQILNSFDEANADTNYWQYFDGQGGQHYQTSDNADSALGWLNVTYPTNEVAEGTGSMLLDYSAHNSESWGGYTKLEHWNPDSNGVYDWSLYDTLSVWYNNTVAQSIPGRVHLRINLHDVSDAATGNKTYDVGDCEYYYSFQYVLDNEPGWHRIDIPLVNNYNWDGAGFNLTGWSGVQGNQILDKNKIKGYSLEFSINGGGEGDFVTGQILLDKLHLRGIAERPVVFFNGAAIPSTSELFAWNGTAEVALGEGATPESPNAIKWVHGDGQAWTGFGWNIAPTDLTYHWTTDTLKFKMKAEAGTGNLRLQWEDGAAKIGANFDPIADGEWHDYMFPLADLTTYYDGTADFKYDSVRVFQILTEGTGAGSTVYLDDIWTGNPTFDVLAPDAPALVTAAGGSYVNLVTWVDVPGEANEVYDVYYSNNPITDITADGIEVVAVGVEENLQLIEHVLRAPVVDQDVTYYYAVVCKDAAGNSSELKAADAPLTNTAKGVTVINPTAPAGFVADGTLTEWEGIVPFRMFPSDGSGTIVTNQKIDGDADLSVNAYVAMDAENLYVSFDVEDDIITSDPAKASYLRDAPDLFIGLYDWRGATHTGPQRGAEPDYQIRFNKESMIIGNVGDTQIGLPGDGNYAWVEKFPSGYAIEAKIPFATLAAAANPDDALFTPVVGKRIKIDFSVNDADATGEREGIMTYSPLNEDQSWAQVNRWLYTWIGDQFVDVEDQSVLPTRYELSQNYPNPFNPTTVISYSVMNKGNVSLKVFNILGQEVASLVNKEHAPGVYQVNFDASTLSTGMYIYQIQAGSFVTSKKMLLIK